MNKYILMLSFISVVFVGCNTNQNINIDDVLDNKENQTQEVENNLPAKNLEEKYKISDTYYISSEKLEMDDSLISLFAQKVKYKEQHELVNNNGKLIYTNYLDSTYLDITKCYYIY